MSGIWKLTLAHARHHRVRSALLIACIALSAWLPATVQTLFVRYRDGLSLRAAATPMVVGPRGNRFDLTLGALYFRESRLDPVPFSVHRELTREEELESVPLHTGFGARGRPLVGTTPDYYSVRGLVASQGELPLWLGDAVLGSSVASSLGLGPGDTLFTDAVELYDISQPPSLELNVVGVLARSGTPDDDAVFVDVKTCWLVAGLLHGHVDVAEEGVLPEGFELSRTESSVSVSPALIEHQRVTDQNREEFHLHEEEDDMPLSAVLVFPSTKKAGTLFQTRLNQEGELQALTPRLVVADLLSFVFRIKRFLDVVAMMLLATTVLFTGLVLWLSTRLRAEEFRVLDAMGCARWTVVRLAGGEVVLLAALGLGLAALGLGATLGWLPDLVRAL